MKRETFVVITSCIDRDFVDIILRNRTNRINVYRTKTGSDSHGRFLRFINNGKANKVVILPYSVAFHVKRDIK